MAINQPEDRLANVTSGHPGTIGSVATERTVAEDDRRTNLLNRISWGAALAGVITALVVQILINMLGVGIGLSSMSATDIASNPDASTFSTSAGIWYVASGIVASFVGGAVAGRLCGSPHVNTARWHGFVAWATTTLLIFYLLTSAAGGLIGGAFSALGSTLSGVGKSASSAVSGVASNTDSDALQAQVRRLVNPNDAQSAQDNVVNYLKAAASGDQQAANSERDRAVDSLARAANVSPDEARNRLNQAEQQYRQTLDQAKQKAAQAAQAARKGVAQAGIFGFVALVLGAIAAWFGGGVGTPRREMSLLDGRRG